MFNAVRAYIFIIAPFVIFTGCQNHDVKKKDLAGLAKDSTKYTSIKWIDSLKDIGAVEAGKKTEIKFRFKNTGEKPLYIVSAEPGCGCTIADYPKGAIAPGAEGMITAAYDVRKGTQGEFRKNIHVTTNTKGTKSHYIYFYGIIKNEGDSTGGRSKQTARLEAIKQKALKRNFLLNPVKN